jgi:hypothetical protein
VREDVTTSRGAAFIGNPLRARDWAFGAAQGRVDLCPRCADDRDAEAACRARVIGMTAAVLGALAVLALICFAVGLR